ncbi:protein THEMIS2 [Labrus mixtus]|uniref:protein THEMIS2 n=1 Tax=Labrus mixtus TaxID=508554 RepID=UPI0029BFC5DB|nr:protein THEMIS2 [Labrus mixtus]
MACTTALPLQQLIASLDNTCLPKILQVCSGVYFQGSIYELSGSEVCFSTGDLIKVIDIEPLSVCCEDISNNEKFELPINHTGLFKVVPEEMPYSSVEEMLSLRPVGLESCLPFTFTCSSKMTLGNFTLGAGRALTVLSIEQQGGTEDQVRCHVQGQQEASAEVCIPLSVQGEFRECESKECFTVQEIMASPCLRSRKFRFINANKCEQPLIFTPIYQVHAIMNMRKNVLKFPSSLEVDVVDVTELSLDVNFVTPLTLTEVLSQPPESFPVVVEILESPDNISLFKSSWLPELTRRKSLVFHKTGTSAFVLLSSMKSRKMQQYFLVSQQYGGRLRRRPREFESVYQLYVASIQAPGLKVSVTRNCDEVEEEGLPSLSVGEQLEVVRCERMELPAENKGQKQSVEALLCLRLPEPDDDDEDDEENVKQEDEREEVFLPLYMQGHFVEVLAENKKYKLRDLGKEFSLPLDVKVVSRDTELETDPLVGFQCLRIEGAMLEPVIQVSLLDRPDHCFEIPTKWLNMSVYFTKDPLPWPRGQPPECSVDRVTEVTDRFFYEFQKRGGSDAAPPPRPPKRNLSSSEACKKTKPSKKSSKADKAKHRPDKSIPSKEFADLTLNSKRRPPAPPPPALSDDQPPPIARRKHSGPEMTTAKALPNTYVQREEAKRNVLLCAVEADVEADVDSDHDYETVDESLIEMMKTAQESIIFF